MSLNEKAPSLSSMSWEKFYKHLLTIEHSQIGLQKLWDLIKDYPKDQVKFIMEATGIYHLGLLNELQKQGYFVHVANPLLIKKYFGRRDSKRENRSKRCLETFSLWD